METLIDNTWELGFGIEYEDKWIPIEIISSKIIYEIIISKRNKLKNYILNPAHKVVHTIQKNLTPEEQNYWWKMNHDLVSIEQTESKFKQEQNGQLVSPKCPLFNYEKRNERSLQLRLP